MKLYYFNIRARAEGIRFILAQAGVEYEDVRVERTDLPALKPTMPMQQMPCLQLDDGRKLCQSMTIARYLARKYSLTGADEWESALCDQYVDGVQDMLPKLRPAAMAFMSGDKAKQKEELATVAKESLPDFLKRYEQFLVDNGSGWLVGKQVTWADLLVSEYLSRLDDKDWLPGLVDSYPHLKALVDKVHALPNIKAWVAKRPQTGF